MTPERRMLARPLAVALLVTFAAACGGGGGSSPASDPGAPIDPANRVAAPTFTPGAGSYVASVDVTLATSTAGATVYYTTDGSDPILFGVAYAGPIHLTVTTTLKAAAHKGGMSDSAAATATFTITSPLPVADPTFWPPAGTYPPFTEVALATSTVGASIRYTLDGSDPSNVAGTLYGGALTLDASATVKAIAFAAGAPSSQVVSAAYTIAMPAPTMSVPAGPYLAAFDVTLATTSGASIRYTTDGSDPSDVTGTLYAGPIHVASDLTLKAVAYVGGFVSPIAQAAYTVIPPAATPTFQPAPGTYDAAVTVTITCATPGASIHYTVDGSEPSASSGTFLPSGGAFVLDASAVHTVLVKAIAYSAGSDFGPSPVASATYVVLPVLPVVAEPTFSPAPGTYTGPVAVFLSVATPAADIFYTTDGSDPVGSGIRFDPLNPITVSVTTTLRAYGFKSGSVSSQTVSGTYTITLSQQAAAPTFTPPPGTYDAAQLVTLASSTPGASIRYTTNGADPTVSGATYSGPVLVDTSMTLKAVASASGFLDSTVTSGAYVINSGALVLRVAAGADHTLGSKLAAVVKAWGSDTAGQLGDGPGVSTGIVQVALPGAVAGFAGKAGESLAWLPDGSLWSWGKNTNTGTGAAGRFSPVQVAGVANVAQADANANHDLAVTSGGAVFAWGNNTFGQLGADPAGLPATTTPTAVAGLSNVALVAAGSRHSLALRGDGTLWAWGLDNFAQLGVPSGSVSTCSGAPCARSPVQITNLTTWTGVSAGTYFTVATRTGGTVWAWGSNTYRQVGLEPTSVSTSSPQQIGAAVGLTGVTAVSAGDYHALALKGDGTVWAWGRNDQGQLGLDPSTLNTSIPRQVPGLANITAIAAGPTTSVAGRADGVVFAWGQNGASQLLGLDPTVASTSVPVQVPGF